MASEMVERVSACHRPYSDASSYASYPPLSRFRHRSTLLSASPLSFCTNTRLSKTIRSYTVPTNRKTRRALKQLEQLRQAVVAGHEGPLEEETTMKKSSLKVEMKILRTKQCREPNAVGTVRKLDDAPRASKRNKKRRETTEAPIKLPRKKKSTTKDKVFPMIQGTAKASKTARRRLPIPRPADKAGLMAERGADTETGEGPYFKTRTVWLNFELSSHAVLKQLQYAISELQDGDSHLPQIGDHQAKARQILVSRLQEQCQSWAQIMYTLLLMGHDFRSALMMRSKVDIWDPFTRLQVARTTAGALILVKLNRNWYAMIDDAKHLIASTRRRAQSFEERRFLKRVKRIAVLISSTTPRKSNFIGTFKSLLRTRQVLCMLDNGNLALPSLAAFIHGFYLILNKAKMKYESHVRERRQKVTKEIYAVPSPTCHKATRQARRLVQHANAIYTNTYRVMSHLIETFRTELQIRAYELHCTGELVPFESEIRRKCFEMIKDQACLNFVGDVKVLGRDYRPTAWMCRLYLEHLRRNPRQHVEYAGHAAPGTSHRLLKSRLRHILKHDDPHVSTSKSAETGAIHVQHKEVVAEKLTLRTCIVKTPLVRKQAKNPMPTKVIPMPRISTTNTLSTRHSMTKKPTEIKPITKKPSTDQSTSNSNIPRSCLSAPNEKITTADLGHMISNRQERSGVVKNWVGKSRPSLKPESQYPSPRTVPDVDENEFKRLVRTEGVLSLLETTHVHGMSPGWQKPKGRHTRDVVGQGYHTFSDPTSFRKLPFNHQSSQGDIFTERQMGNSAMTIETTNVALGEDMRNRSEYGNECEWETLAAPIDGSESQDTFQPPSNGANHHDSTSDHPQNNPPTNGRGAMPPSDSNGNDGHDNDQPPERKAEPPNDENQDSESDTESAAEDMDSEEIEETEKHIPLTFQIPEKTLRDAMQASPNTKASFWSHTMYRDPKTEDADFKTIKVHYCKTKEVAETVAKYFLEEKVIGFDVEWKVDFRPGDIKENASLIQIACENRIALFHIALFKGQTAEELVPPTLKTLLESPDIAKVGVAIKGDFTRCRTYLGIKSCNQVELSRLNNLVMYRDTEPHKVNNKLVGMAKQVHAHLQLPMAKGDVRQSDWSKPLNMEQIEYAASDAYAGFRIYDVLEMKRMAMKPIPKAPASFDWDGDGDVKRKTVPREKKKTEEKTMTAEVEEEDSDVYETALEDSLDSQELDAESELGTSESEDSDGESDAEYVPPARRLGKMVIRNEDEGIGRATERPQRVGRVSLAALRNDRPYFAQSDDEDNDAGFISMSQASDEPGLSMDVNINLSSGTDDLDNPSQSGLPAFTSFEDRLSRQGTPRPKEKETFSKAMEGDNALDNESATLLQAMAPNPTKAKRKGKVTSKIDQREDKPLPVYLQSNITLQQNEDGQWMIQKEIAPAIENTTKSKKEKKERKNREAKDGEDPSTQPSNQAVDPSPSALNPRPPTPQYPPTHTLATTWAQAYLHSTLPSPSLPPVPRIRATISHLRAYHLWHHQRLSITEIARILRPEPEEPLKESTVANYILQAVMLERLEYRPEELRGVLEGVPRVVREGRFRWLASRVGGGGAGGGGVSGGV